MKEFTETKTLKMYQINEKTETKTFEMYQMIEFTGTKTWTIYWMKQLAETKTLEMNQMIEFTGTKTLKNRNGQKWIPGNIPDEGMGIKHTIKSKLILILCIAVLVS